LSSSFLRPPAKPPDVLVVELQLIVQMVPRKNIVCFFVSGRSTKFHCPYPQLCVVLCESLMERIIFIARWGSLSPCNHTPRPP
jgi:hypothetical protein